MLIVLTAERKCSQPSPRFLWKSVIEIHSHVFKCDYISMIESTRKRWLLVSHRNGFYNVSYPQATLALLCVDHQISDEAATYFYANTRFEGEWSQIAAFVKGIAARRRDMIRSLEISHPYPTAFGSEGAEVLELLSALANLRIVRIAASKPDWTRLQTELIRGGTLNLAGKFDITVHNTVYGDLLPSFSTSPAGKFARDERI